MKRYLSVFEMITRSSIYKVLGILAALAIAELGMFYISLQQPLAGIQPNLEEIVDQSHFVYAFGVAYLLMTVVLVLPGTNMGSMQGYTLQRLRIKENKVFLLQSIYNVFCYILLWAAQLGILLIASGYYMTHKTDAVRTNQTVFLAFHRNDFMHSILPSQDIFSWFILIYLIVGTGILAALFTKNQRNGSIAWSLFLFAAIACICFPRGLGEEVWMVVLSCIIWTVYAFIKEMLGTGVEKNEKQK